MLRFGKRVAEKGGVLPGTATPRTYARYAAFCNFSDGTCSWNDRSAPTYHSRRVDAWREASAHAREAAHISVNELTVRRERKVQTVYTVVGSIKTSPPSTA